MGLLTSGLGLPARDTKSVLTSAAQIACPARRLDDLELAHSYALIGTIHGLPLSSTGATQRSQRFPNLLERGQKSALSLYQDRLITVYLTKRVLKEALSINHSTAPSSSL